MFELSGVLDKGTQQLTDRVPNSISLNAGCELFNLFVTVATHDLGVCASLSSTQSPTHAVSPFLESLRLQGQTCPPREPVHRGSRPVQRKDRWVCRWVRQGWISGTALSCVVALTFSLTPMSYHDRSSRTLTPEW